MYRKSRRRSSAEAGTLLPCAYDLGRLESRLLRTNEIEVSWRGITKGIQAGIIRTQDTRAATKG